MERKLNFWVMGGDMRQAKLAQLLAEDGHTVHTYALDGVPSPIPGLISETAPDGAGKADCVILPMPPASEGGRLNAPLSPHPHPLPPILDALSPAPFLCGGRIDPITLEAALTRGLSLHDYFDREELTVTNAVPTAEGAVQLAMEHLPITIHGTRVLVVGFGRVGRVTACKFYALGAQVAVAARKYDQLAWAQAMGLNSIHLEELPGHLTGYDLILNTAPSLVLPQPLLEKLRPDCLILDLASKPGGGGVPFGAAFANLLIVILDVEKKTGSPRFFPLRPALGPGVPALSCAPTSQRPAIPPVGHIRLLPFLFAVGYRAAPVPPA